MARPRFISGPQNPDTDMRNSLPVNTDLPVPSFTETGTSSSGKYNRLAQWAPLAPIWPLIAPT